MTIKPVLTGFAGRKAICDTEVYPNYCLIKFEDVDTGERHRFVIDETRNESKAAFAYFQSLSVIVTYNGHGFDDHLLHYAFQGADCRSIYELGDEIIGNDVRRQSPLLDRHGDTKSGCPLSIDLAQLLKKFKKHGSKKRFVFPGLKHLGNRFGYPHLQTLPIRPGTILTDEQKSKIDTYNDHDLAITRLVLEHLSEALEMRRALGDVYGTNLTALADAKLGEIIMRIAYTKAVNDRILAEWQQDEEPEYLKLQPPRQTEWVCGGNDILSDRHSFTDPELLRLLGKLRALTLHWKRRTDRDGEIVMDSPSISIRVPLGGKLYNVARGGIHSEDGPLVIDATEEMPIKDIDFGSYYPGLIVKERIAPRHLDADLFCDVLEDMMRRRLEAKEKGHREVAQGLKISINAMYGKLADKYSPFRDPPKGTKVTLNGQLVLLKLIEQLNLIDGVEVLSANTDGLLVRHPKDATDRVYDAMKRVRTIYGTNRFDVADVQRLCRISVGEYVMAYRDDRGNLKLKRKGKSFNDGTETEDLDKKTDFRINKKAATDYLIFDKPIEQTIRECRDLAMFVGYESLNAGWDHIEDADGNQLEQTTNRWYESTNGTVLFKVDANGKRSRFAKMLSVVVVNDIPDQLPADVNYEYYIAEAQKVVDDILHPSKKQESRRKKADKLTEEEREEWEYRQSATDADVERLLSFDLNYYRDLYTGLVKHNPYESMRYALKALWKANLGLTKADLIWCFDSFNTADGYFDDHSKYRNMLSRIDWIVDNIVPIEKDVFPDDPDDDEPVSVTVFDDEPGGGKTRYALKQIVSNGPGVYWWAINKISPLATERFTELMTYAEQAGVTIDFLPIHSEASGRGTMKMRIDKRMKEINDHPLKDQTVFVTIITHKTLIDHYLSNVTGILLIDEPVQIWEQRHFEFPASYRTIRQLIVPENVHDAYDGDLNANIDADTQAIRFRLTEEGRDELNDEAKKRDTMYSSTHWILEQAHKASGRVFALAEQWNNLDDPDTGGELDVLALLHPRHVAHFDRCIMMAAHFKELLIYELWSELYDVQWDFRPIENGWKRIVALRDRVTLYYVLENRQVTDTYLTNRGDPKRRRAMAQAVAEFFGDAPFIWSVSEAQKETGDYNCLPNDVTGVDGHCHPAYLTPKANGINAYQNVHAAAWLGSIKLPTTLLDIVGRLWGRQDAERMSLIEYELYSCLQFLTRINSRRFDSADQVRYVVADKVQAEYVTRMCDLCPDKVLPLPMQPALKAALDDVANKGRGRKATKTDEEMREAHRQHEAKRRAAKAAAEGRKPGRAGRPKKAGIA